MEKESVHKTFLCKLGQKRVKCLTYFLKKTSFLVFTLFLTLRIFDDANLEIVDGR